MFGPKNVYTLVVNGGHVSNVGYGARASWPLVVVPAFCV